LNYFVAIFGGSRLDYLNLFLKHEAFDPLILLFDNAEELNSLIPSKQKFYFWEI